jgi:hypothetical protein
MFSLHPSNDEASIGEENEGVVENRFGQAFEKDLSNPNCVKIPCS